MTPAIILFRYHKAFDVCIQKIAILKQLNPDIPVHGLYGGNDPLDTLPVELTSLLASNWAMPLDDPYYKWKNGDLCARWWFRDHGQKIAFDHVYFLEWDMLFVKPLKAVYGTLEKNTNYATIFGDYKNIDETRWYWINGAMGVETEQLMEHLAKQNMPVDITKLFYPIMGGTAFCRQFLEKYIAAPVPSYTNDEVRLTLYSAAFGIAMKNNGIWDRMESGLNIYNADNEELSEKDLDHVLEKGGDALHPLRIVIEDLDRKLGL